jgi:hypothetical protein
MFERAKTASGFTFSSRQNVSTSPMLFPSTRATLQMVLMRSPRTAFHPRRCNRSTQLRNGYRIGNGVQSRDIDARNVLLTDDYPLMQSCISKRTARPQRVINPTGCPVIADGMALGEHVVFLLAVAVAVIRPFMVTLAIVSSG